MTNNDTERQEAKGLLCNLPFHPILLGIYPALFLIAHNDLAFMGYTIVPALGLALSALLLLGLFRLVFRDIRKAALITSICYIIFFSTFPIFHAFEPHCLWMGADFVWAIAGIELLFFLVFLHLVRNHLGEATRFFNILASVLALIAIVQIGYDLISSPAPDKAMTAEGAIRYEIDPNAPDIYVIILDSYAGKEALQKCFNYNNDDFYNALAERDFTVVEKSRSNYSRSKFSISSTLNMCYSEEFFPPNVNISDLNISRRMAVLIPRFVKNHLIDALRPHGYRSIHFLNGWQRWGAHITKSDRNDILVPAQDSGEFISLLANMSLIRRIYMKHQVDQIRKHTFSSLAKLSELPNQYNDRPKFVCAHLIPPQHPFCFHADGSPRPATADDDKRPAEEQIPRYLEQIQFINREMLKLVDSLKQKSAKEPIIVVMSDHSFRFDDNSSQDALRYFSNLIAVSMPGDKDSLLPAKLDNVNLFRCIMNLQFGTEYEMLPPRYSSWPPEPFIYEEEPESNQEKEESNLADPNEPRPVNAE